MIVVLIVLIFIGTTAGTDNKKEESKDHESKEELVQSETKDGKLEIIKQIKKVNDDGSYTIGYEADDGSFKIESRDVLGNIKGTYGYIDDHGEIKRVSYSTSNSSEILTKPVQQSSVVQRIPKINRTTSTTRRPYYTPTPTRFTKVRSSTTTSNPNYGEVINMDSTSKTTPKPEIYTTPKILLQGKPILRSTPATQTQRSEGQLIRPEISVHTSTELPLFRRLALKNLETKPVEEVTDETKGNILRRQLSENQQRFNPQQHIIAIQQSLGGNDVSDVYSGGVSTGTPKPPLFTTTLRPRAFLSTTTTPTVVSRPTVLHSNYQKNNLQDIEPTGEESNTAENGATPTPVPVVQIPANRPITPEPLVAIKHPFQRTTILVPLSQIQNGRILVDERGEANEQYIRETTPRPNEEQPRPIFVRRLPPPHFRPIPVQVDSNGYIREAPQNPNNPYTYPVPITPTPTSVRPIANSDLDNGIDQISPPVSTRDLQRLLQQLIIRQARLERINALTDPRRHPEFYQPQYQQYRPYYNTEQNIQYIQNDRRYLPQGPERHDYNQDSSHVPSRRVARVLPPSREENEEYLPPDVREMLLLRMLQLAINPALPVMEDEQVESSTVNSVQYKKVPIRNVEILGEEPEEDTTRHHRPKRFKEYHQEK